VSKGIAQAASTAVVIVDWNSGELITRCLTALARQTVRPGRVVVVDNASQSESWRHVGPLDLPIEMVRLAANRGFAAGTNRGISLASDAAWIALLNPDAFPEPEWLERLLAAAAAHPEYSFFACRQVMADDPSRLDGSGDEYAVTGLGWRRGHGEPAAKAPPGPGEIFGPCAAAALYRQDALADVGGLDESFFCYFEDVDLAFRLRLAGHRCLYVPDATVLHVGSASSGRGSDFAVYHGHRNLVWTFVKNMPGPLLALYAFHHLLLNLLSVVWLAFRGQGGAAWRAKRDALRGLAGPLRQRRAIQIRRRIGPWEVRRAMVRGWRAFGLPPRRPSPRKPAAGPRL
jgi:GT2 family glycosyltransferase